jgi:hypothetical protein
MVEATTGHARTIEKRREPAVFRAQRAHARSRGPQVWDVQRRDAAHECQKCSGRLNERRAVVGQPETPSPPASRWSPDRLVRRESMPDHGRATWRRGPLPLLPWLTVGALVAPRPAAPSCASVVARSSYVKGVLHGHVRAVNGCPRHANPPVWEPTRAAST